MLKSSKSGSTLYVFQHAAPEAAAELCRFITHQKQNYLWEKKQRAKMERKISKKLNTSTQKKST